MPAPYYPGNVKRISPRPKKFRRIGWSVVAAAVLGVIGVVSIGGNAFLLFDRIFDSSPVSWSDVPWAFRFWEIELRVVGIMAGVLLIAAAYFLTRGRFRFGGILATVGVLAFACNSTVNSSLRKHFAGDSYAVESVQGERVIASFADQPKQVRGSPELLQAPFDDFAIRTSRNEWAVYVKRSEFETNSLGIELALIPAGEFLLGSHESLRELEITFPVMATDANKPFKDSFESEHPQGKVRITRAFYIGTTNVTVGQFRRFVEATNYVTEAESNGVGGGGYAVGENPPLIRRVGFNWRFTGFEQSDDSPVVNVSWNDAMAFCEWLSKSEGRGYRLPTDAEWEYACRAGSTSRYSFGDNFESLITVANIADKSYYTTLLGVQLPPEAIDRGVRSGVMVNGDDGFAFTSPVGKLKSNGFRLRDMHGNAATWCIDAAIAKNRSVSVVAENPRSTSTDGPTRIVRGGHWQSFPAFCRSASRFAYQPSSCEVFLGMRLVCELPEE